MIKVNDLTRRYGAVEAVTGLNFEVAKGEVVGFLGPNGAGKTTTMRILAGYIPPTSGSARIAGFDVFEESKDARACIGYLPENVPLYTDMRVEEYLRYRAALKGVPGRKMRERIADVSELCGIVEVLRRIIGTLSKGYRQRVGIADALIHEPQILILDEPTIGLDPNQIRHIRELIHNLAKRHTILLSSHILPEVEMTCSRALIIHNGRIKASDTPSALIERLKTVRGVRLEARAPQAEAIQALRALEGVREAVVERGPDDWETFTLRAEPGADVRESVVKLFGGKGWRLREIAQRPVTLEDVFVDVTQAD